MLEENKNKMPKEKQRGPGKFPWKERSRLQPRDFTSKYEKPFGWD